MERTQAACITLLALFLVNFLNVFDRVIPAVVLEPIRKEFFLSDTMLGLLATAFTLVYAVAGVPIGRLTDKRRRTRLLSGGVFCWSLLTAASGAATNFLWFFLIRLGVGVGEATCAPAANSIIGDLYPSEKRSRALGLFMLGIPIGTLAAFAGGGWLALHYGWRTPFLVAAVPGVFVALFLLFIPEPLRGSQEDYIVNSSEPITHPFRKVMSIKTLWWMTISGAFFNFAAYSLNTFLSPLMMRYHHASLSEAGVFGAVVFGVAGLIGLTLGGQIADRIYKVLPTARLYSGAFSLVLSAPLLWFGLNQPQGEIVALTVFVSVGWLLCFMYFVTVLPSIHDVVEPRLRGTAMSIFFFFQYVLGASFGSVVTGILSDHFALSALQATGGAEMTDAIQALGLKASLSAVVPISVLLAGVAIFFSARYFIFDFKMVGERSAKAITDA